MAQSTAECPDRVHLSDVDGEHSTEATTALLVDMPPDYSEHPNSTESSRSQYDTPPPSYTVPLEQPPPYRAPSQTVASPDVRFSPSQSDQITMNIRSAILRQEIVQQSSNMSILRLVLACGVFWCCGFIFGAVAFSLAMMSRREPHSPGANRMNVYFGRASVAVSLIGIAFGAIVLTLVFSMLRGAAMYENPVTSTTLSPFHPTTTTSAVTATKRPPCIFTLDGACYLYTSSLRRAECEGMNGSMGYHQETHTILCYLDKCTDYVVHSMCFKYRSAILSRLGCRDYDGYYEATGYNAACYYNKCPGYEARNGACFKTRKTSSRADCINGYYEDSFCFT